MAETDIFNPTNWQALGFAFNPNPSYGFTRKMGANRQVQRPRFGIYPSRDVLNGGHVFSLSWLNTDITTAERISSFYHNFKAGYFTLIDQDYNGRQYVGRFMTEPEISHPANSKYTIQGVVFEEMPRARMLQYPTNFAVDGHPLFVVDDYINPLAALMQGGWVTQISPLVAATGSSSSITPAAIEAYNQTAAVGDWAATGYVGFGFQMVFRIAANLGVVHILLDNNYIVEGLDLSTGNATQLIGDTLTLTPSVGSVPAYVTLSEIAVLDAHVVKVVYAANSTGGGTGMIFPPLTYIY